MSISITRLLILSFALLFVGLLTGRYLVAPQTHSHEHHAEHESMHGGEERQMFLSMRNEMVGEMIAEGNYACCLEKPCTYCIEKTPGHGEGATCNCLEDIMTGNHPCGECIGEILEGHGNRFLAKYFATALAEEVGEEHLARLQSIISEKYGITNEEQI